MGKLLEVHFPSALHRGLAIGNLYDLRVLKVIKFQTLKLICNIPRTLFMSIRAAISHNVRLQVMRKSLHSLSPLTLCYDNPLDVQVNGTSLLVFLGISSELRYSILGCYIDVCRCAGVELCYMSVLHSILNLIKISLRFSS